METEGSEKWAQGRMERLGEEGKVRKERENGRDKGNEEEKRGGYGGRGQEGGKEKGGKQNGMGGDVREGKGRKRCWERRGSNTIRYDTRCYFNVRSKADISQLNLPHGTDN